MACPLVKASTKNAEWLNPNIDCRRFRMLLEQRPHIPCPFSSKGYTPTQVNIVIFNSIMKQNE